MGAPRGAIPWGPPRGHRWKSARGHARHSTCSSLRALTQPDAYAAAGVSVRLAQCTEDANQGLTLSLVLVPSCCLRDAMCFCEDETVVQMIRSVGKVEHSDVRINFREFVTMCWKWFFEEPPEDDEASDVRDAFEILGGGPGTEGEVETRKLKLFATELNLTIDVDKFVGEVDEDGSGKVDYDEFCKLFADSKIDTNLHDTGEMWLRHDKDEILKKTPAVASGRRSASPTGLTINTDEPSVQHPEAPGTASRPDSAFFDARSHEQSVSVVRHRDGFFGDEAPAHVNSAALHAPKMKKVLQNTAPKFERREYYNSGKTMQKSQI